VKPGFKLLSEDVSIVNNTLNIKHVKKEDEGIYICEGRNMFGSTFTALSVKVKDEGKLVKRRKGSHRRHHHQN
jgi:hypothetical protein